MHYEQLLPTGNFPEGIGDYYRLGRTPESMVQRSGRNGEGLYGSKSVSSASLGLSESSMILPEHLLCE